MSKSIDEFVRPQVRGMVAVDWGEVPDDSPYRLMWGENPQLLEVYREAVMSEIDRINLYPSPTKSKLRQKIAEYTGVKSDNIVCNNGSDEAIELLCRVFINDGDEIVLTSPTFPVYETSAQVMGGVARFVPLEADFSLDTDKLLAAVTPKTKMVWLANPNNPTGNLLVTKDQIEMLAQKLACILVIDECYFELACVTAASLVLSYPNVMVLRSFTKILGMAGARLGYVIADERVTDYLNRVQQTNQVFNINRFAQAGGIAILSRPDIIQQSIQVFTDLKDSFEKGLTSAGLEVVPTVTTFCIAKLPSPATGKQLKDLLGKKGIYIKDCSIYAGFGTNYIFLGVPTSEYQEPCVAAIKEALEGILA